MKDKLRKLQEEAEIAGLNRGLLIHNNSKSEVHFVGVL
jgi:hypothetical protein